MKEEEDAPTQLLQEMPVKSTEEMNNEELIQLVIFKFL